MKHTATELLKFKRLVRELRKVLGAIPIDYETVAVGILERLWHATIRDAKDGRIGDKYAPDDLAEAVGWHGDESQLVDILVACEWLDLESDGTLVVHDWMEHAPSFVKACNSAKHRAPHERHSVSPPSGPPSGPPSNITKRNITKPNEKKTRKRFIAPSVLEVSEYCQERKNAVNAEQFVDHYTANGWKQANGNPIKDWKAAVRTWERNNVGNSRGSPDNRTTEQIKAARETSPDIAAEAERSRRAKIALDAYRADPCDATRKVLEDLDVYIPELPEATA